MTATLLTMVTTRTDSRAMQMAERVAAVAFVTVLTAIGAQVSIPLPFTPVPFTFQPMIVLVGAAALGARLGAASQILYLTLGIAGLPVFAASPVLPQGAARLLGPTGGYLLSYPVAAFVTGWLAERGLDRRYWTSFLAMLCGLALVFAGGVSWLAVAAVPARGFAGAVASGFVPFVLPDLVKLAAASGVMPALWRVVGGPNTSRY
jgi:biotin transport system substrate-specific component